jgi:MSHA pilin protein MshD
MCNKPAAGFTLIEMIIAIVIISVGLAGLLLAFNTTVKSSADPMIHKQMLSIAEEMMEEIRLKPMTVGAGTIADCNRTAADDVADYAGYNQPICDIDGAAVGVLAGYTVAVAQDATAAANLTNGTTAVPAIKITVTVTHGSETFSLVGWRTAYGS